jgi:hypothetical protein
MKQAKRSTGADIKARIAHRSELCWLTNPLHRIAARLRFGMNPTGLGVGGKR